MRFCGLVGDSFSRAATLCVLILTARGELNAQSASYVGAKTCGNCHATHLAGQSASAHARALSPAAQHALAVHFAPKGELIRPPRFHFEFRRTGAALRVRVSDERDSVDMPIEWAFGAGDHAVTFVSRIDADWYLEHYFSYYPAINGLRPSPGHEGFRSNTLQLARGVLYRSVDPVTGVLKCFECHSTGPPHIELDREIRPQEMGVRCEACHGPGSLHVEAVSQGQPERSRRLIQNPKRMSGPEINEFCGRCHRSPQDEALTDWDKAWNVRHQPIYLAQSACFLKSQGALSCLTCHNLHQKLDRDSASYDRKCVGCHKFVKHSLKSEYRATTNCVECHMPRVSPQSHIEFTNHFIGVYSNENKLRPQP